MYAVVILYRTEAMSLQKAQIKIVEYAVVSCFMKLFKTKSKEIVCDCMSFFSFQDFATCYSRRKRKFLLKFVASSGSNVIRSIFVSTARSELNGLACR